MTPKKVHKPTPIPESSGGERGPSANIQLPQSIPNWISKVPVIEALGPEDMPKLSERHMPVHTFALIFASYRWIDSNGRFIVLEEIQGMLCINYGKADPFLVANADEYSILFDFLESDTSETTLKLQALDEKKKKTLKVLAQSLLEQLLRNPENRDRDIHLRGFPERMRYLPWQKTCYPWFPEERPTFGIHTSRDDQVYTIFALYWLKDSKGNDVSELDAATMICTLYGYPYIPDCAVFHCLGIPNHSLTWMVENYITEPRHTAFFECKAHEIHERCTKLGLLEKAAPLTPDQGLLPATTAGTGAMSMSMGVTAEPQSIEAQDKGKQKRQGESSSESPPAGSSDVKEGKRPERKHPRH